jgi:hypothetical protein
MLLPRAAVTWIGQWRALRLCDAVRRHIIKMRLIFSAPRLARVPAMRFAVIGCQRQNIDSAALRTVGDGLMYRHSAGANISLKKCKLAEPANLLVFTRKSILMPNINR